jgi:hygromycin-B 7''-O-kinase
MLPAVRTDEEWQAVVWNEKIVRPARKISRPASEYLHGRLPVATPELLACGEYENGWRYVLMSQLPGTELAAAWPAIPRPHQDRVVSEAGELLAALHSLDPEPLDPVLGPADWHGFLAGQRATALERQRQANLPDPWLSQIEDFLESVPLAPGQERVLLHTEVIREHLLVNPSTWTLTGLLDFETAMTGDRAYEFAAAGLFVSRGDPRLLGRLLSAYGRRFDPRELLAYLLLHRHSNLPECLAQLPAPPEPTLDSLALTWFGTA